MPETSEKQRWNCPECGRLFSIAPGKRPPAICPECRDKPATLPEIDLDASAAVALPPVPALQSEAPAKKWKPLAVVLPHEELPDLEEQSREARERRYYAELAWGIVRFWFLVLVGPAVVAALIIIPPIGLVAAMLFLGAVIFLSFPASGQLLS